MTHDPLLNIEDLERYLQNHHLPTLDRFGQHFLVDSDVLQKIVEIIHPEADVPIIEVGAGLGVLTRALADVKITTHAPAPITAVELDRRMIPLLRERVKHYPFVELVESDILYFFPKDVRSFSYDVVGNIPYNISGRLLRHVLSWEPRPRKVVFLIDGEVAKRVCANPPEMNLLGLSVRMQAIPTIALSRISPTAFVPPPKVFSSVLVLELLRTPHCSPEEGRLVFRLARAAFSTKRKTLQNSLRTLWQCTAKEAAFLLESVGIDPHRRPQTLTLDEWSTLAKRTVQKKRSPSAN